MTQINAPDTTSRAPRSGLRAMAGAAATLSTRMKRAVTGLVGEGDVSAHHVEDERGLRDLLSHHEESPEPNLHIVVKDRRMFFKASRRTKDSPGLRITADGLNLSKADLSGRDLEGASLRGTDLSLANLVGTNLQWADLSNASLEMATIGVPSTELLDTVLTGAVFERIRIAVGVDTGMETLASLRKIESRGERGKTIVLTRAEFLKFLREWIGDLPGFPTE